MDCRLVALRLPSLRAQVQITAGPSLRPVLFVVRRPGPVLKSDVANPS